MQVSDAYGDALKKKGSFPHVQGRTKVIDALSILRSQNLTALPIECSKNTIPERAICESTFAVTGYSVLSRLVVLEPSRYVDFFSEPCENSTLSLGAIKQGDDLVSLLQVFESSTFGFAYIEDRKVVISVRDLLRLFENRGLETDLSAVEVSSSPVFSMKKDETLRHLLNETVRRKFRRVLIENSHEIVSDSNVLDYILEKRVEIAKNPDLVLETRIVDIPHEEAPTVEGSMNITGVAKYFLDKKIEVVLTERGIVTPWDLVLKPWRVGRLKILRQERNAPIAGKRSR